MVDVRGLIWEVGSEFVEGGLAGGVRIHLCGGFDGDAEAGAGGEGDERFEAELLPFAGEVALLPCREMCGRNSTGPS
jgi:hypothetical protein